MSEITKYDLLTMLVSKFSNKTRPKGYPLGTVWFLKEKDVAMFETIAEVMYEYENTENPWDTSFIDLWVEKSKKRMQEIDAMRKECKCGNRFVPYMGLTDLCRDCDVERDIKNKPCDHNWGDVKEVEGPKGRERIRICRIPGCGVSALFSDLMQKGFDKRQNVKKTQQELDEILEAWNEDAAGDFLCDECHQKDSCRDRDTIPCQDQKIGRLVKLFRYTRPGIANEDINSRMLSIVKGKKID